MNNCIFCGRTTKEVTMSYTANNTACAKFALAVDTGYGENKKTSFLNMVAWGKTAEALGKHITQSTKLVVQCQAIQNAYQDKNGNKVNTVNFNVVSWEFAESKNAKKESEEPAQNNNTANDLGNGFYNLPESNDEELPFF